MTQIAGARDALCDRDREGVVLAARWSIERLRRPQAPGLVWLGYAKPEIETFACLACGTGGFKQGVLRAAGRTLYLCPACASHQFHPRPAAAAPPAGFARRYQIEYATDLPAAAALAARAVAGRRGGRLLDLGCGIGFVVDMVARQRGWTAAGVDPGPLAELGAALLEADLRRGGAEAMERLPEQAPYTVVLCEGALERSDDPLNLLLATRARAAPDARWLLSVADAATLYATADAAVIRAMTEHAQVLIPSRVGLRLLLSRAGFADAPLAAEAGTLRAYRMAAQSTPDPSALLDAYLTVRLASEPRDECLRTVLLAQALERAVRAGDAAAGDKITRRLAAALAASVEAARAADDQDSLETLLGRAPVCAASLLYHVGLAHLNGGGPSTQALLCFELSAALAARAHALAPGLMHRENEWRPAARFHAGLVLSRMGEWEAARRAFESLDSDPGVADSEWGERARAELDKVPAAPPRPAADGRVVRARRAAGRR